jgi:hypothetical protein
VSYSDYLEEKLLKHTFMGASYTSNSTTYVGLLTATPTDGASYTEVTGSNYNRVALYGSGASQNLEFTSVVSGPSYVSNTSDITFPTATGSWGTVTHAAIFDASTGGNLLAYAELTDPTDFTTSNPKLVTNGDIFRFEGGSSGSGKLRIRLD